MVAIVIAVVGAAASVNATMAPGLKHVKYQVGAAINCLTAQTQGTITCNTGSGTACSATATFTDGSTAPARAWEHGCAVRLVVTANGTTPIANGIPVGATILN
jgi:uncharacterized membrane protein